jgi:hypothetical protein
MEASTALLDMKFEKSPSVVTRKVAGETILVPISRSIGNEPCLYTLDDTATFLWERLDGQRAGRDLAKELTVSYEVATKQAETDVQAFLEQLKSVELIRSL